MSKFILIGGMPRSGTNLARRIIGSHSRIAVPPTEFQFLLKHARGKDVARILAYHRLRDWGVDLAELRHLSHREAFIGALTRYAASRGKDIPGEKSPLNEFFFATAQVWLADYELKFVHLLRNPFDMLASYKHAPFRQDRPAETDPAIAIHARNWQRSASFGAARAYSMPERYHLLKYEDLTADPAGQTEKLCRFLGVDFEPERMLGLADYRQYKDNTSFPEREATVRQGAVRQAESRKHYLSPEEVTMIGQVCGELALALGYRDDDFQAPPPEPSRPLTLEKRLRSILRRQLKGWRNGKRRPALAK